VESRSLSGHVLWTQAGGGGWLLKAEGGAHYFLKGDQSILRLRNGDKVEISGVVTPSSVLGIQGVQVEKVTFSTKG
jgi:hypothetical protein